MNVLDHTRLLCGVAFCAIATAAVAQTATPTATAPAEAGPSADALGEIVVTATKQTNTVNKVPLSITAVTQEGMDQAGLKDVQDLARTVPALTINPGTSNANPNISIRGIVTTAGAATTGVYLDDTPLTKRNVNGVSNNNGTQCRPCSTCHGPELKGDPARGVPDLTDSDWLYGSGSVAEIQETITYGIGSGNHKARSLAVMLAYLLISGQLRDAGRLRLVVTLLFGLIHGFGFASDLLEMRLPAGRLAELLVGFNMGVQIEQVALVLVIIGLTALLVRARRRSRLDKSRRLRRLLVHQELRLDDRQR